MATKYELHGELEIRYTYYADHATPGMTWIVCWTRQAGQPWKIIWQCNAA